MAPPSSVEPYLLRGKTLADGFCKGDFKAANPWLREADALIDSAFAADKKKPHVLSSSAPGKTFVGYPVLTLMFMRDLAREDLRDHERAAGTSTAGCEAALLPMKDRIESAVDSIHRTSARAVCDEPRGCVWPDRVRVSDVEPFLRVAPLAAEDACQGRTRNAANLVQTVKTICLGGEGPNYFVSVGARQHARYYPWFPLRKTLADLAAYLKSKGAPAPYSTNEPL